MRSLYEEALPYYLEGDSGTFTGAEGATIAFQAFRTPGATRAIVLAPGRTEGSHTFMQLEYDLRVAGYDLYVIDHRGQGASSRLTADPLKGHVDNFEHYIADYDQLVQEIVQPHGYEKLYAVGHSMGSAITLHYVLAHPATFAAVAVSAPMVQIDTAPLTEDAALWYATSVPPEETLPFGYDWTTRPKFAGNYLTTDQTQFETLFETDNIFPERRVGRATYGWSAEAIRAGRVLRARAAELAPPIVLFQAGDDKVVAPAPQTALCAAAQRCELVTFLDARHELFFANDRVRGEILQKLLELFSVGR